MFSKNKKYLFILVVIIALLPAALVALFEISSLQQNEKVIEQAYHEQLNSILFSVNQYTDDVLRSTIREIDYSFQYGTDTSLSVFTNYSFINDFFFLTRGKLNSLTQTNKYASEIKNKAGWILAEHKNTLKRLVDFYTAGYYRLEPFPIANTGQVLFVFVIKKDNQLQPVAIVVDALTFIEDRLDAQIQKIAAEKFEIAVINSKNETIYRSGNGSSEIELTSPLRAFSEFSLGIALEGETIKQLVQSRTTGNIYFICIVSFILLIAGWLVIRILGKQIELANLKSDFVSNVSHEIRTPLALINMYTETIEMGRVTSQKMQKDYLKIILQETNRLSLMVNKILNFSQIEKEMKKYSFAPGNLNTIVEEAFNTYIPYLKNLGFTYNLELDSRLTNIVMDAEAIKDVLVNLIDNAIKYSFENKSVTVRTGLHVNKAYVEVQDLGIGISEKNKKYIFEKFYRVSRDDVSIKVKGSGLGLSIVKHIADAHKGKIVITSKIGKGSTFRILFPLN